ncbi:divergent AAA domain protein [Clostridium ragsdalei P11]|uniref:Divergent AAA domain protein n=1 Tax=Clostridium ragsdalei P11 TaxID=1353534 RepID=A0A1A6AS99_9CLOT|nr:ATP-binding protein [Clostridium ragsdalei]OBR92944.1 divergent AAA domain protein [Clostridium ragsdalei P11]
MSIEEILSGESKCMEFKEMLPEKSSKYMKTVVAFANGHGGKLIFRIRDDNHEVVGIDDDSIFKTMDSITNAISDSCEPVIIPDVTLQTIDGKTIIVVEISAGKQRPYYIKSLGMEKGIYVRTAGTTRPADNYMIKELMFEGANRCFDQTPCIGYTVSKADFKNLCSSLRKTAIENCKTDAEKAEVKKVTTNTLLSWGVLAEQNGELIPTNAFALLSGNPILQTKIQCGVFKGTTRAVFVDRREFAGSIQNQIEKAYKYVLEKINLGAKINGLYRQDEYELPIGSVREIIANAVTHRSYLEPGNVQVALYDDRLEVTSPGMLLTGVTIEKIREGYSKVRNRAIANAFVYMKIIEQWGSGIPRIFEEFKEYGLKEPELIDLDGDFRVNLYRIVLNTIQNATQSTTQNATQSTTQTIQNTIPNMKLTYFDETVIKTIMENPIITQSEIALELGWAVNRVKYYIKKLKDKGILKHKGNNRRGIWEVHLKNEQIKK